MIHPHKNFKQRLCMTHNDFNGRFMYDTPDCKIAIADDAYVSRPPRKDFNAYM